MEPFRNRVGGVGWGGDGGGGGGGGGANTHRHTCKSKPSTACDEVRRRGVNRVCRYHGSHFHLTGRERQKKNTKSQGEEEGVTEKQ